MSIFHSDAIEAPSNMAVILFFMFLPIFFVWVVSVEAWKLVTRWLR